MNKSIFVSALLSAALIATTAPAQNIDMGDDSGEFANDGECDDARFAGPGMASSINTANVGTDASDCMRLMQANELRLVRTQAEWDVDMCQKVVFGDDTSEYANDGQCDDPRFVGSVMHEILNVGDRLRDATDCRRACEAGYIWLR